MTKPDMDTRIATLRASLIEKAQEAGYRVHHATEGYLSGLWWWTLYRPGWGEPEVSADEWPTEAEAWDGAIVNHTNELMESKP